MISAISTCRSLVPIATASDAGGVRCRRPARALEIPAPEGAPDGRRRARGTRSTPYNGMLPIPARKPCASIIGENVAFTGSESSTPIHVSSMPPLARISRSVLPDSVSIDERKEPVAASPARSIATTTATPSATASTVSRVRARSRRRGRRMSRRRSFMARIVCGRRADVRVRRRWRRLRHCGWPSGRSRRASSRRHAAGRAPGRRWRYRDCR